MARAAGPFRAAPGVVGSRRKRGAPEKDRGRAVRVGPPALDSHARVERTRPHAPPWTPRGGGGGGRGARGRGYVTAPAASSGLELGGSLRGRGRGSGRGGVGPRGSASAQTRTPTHALGMGREREKKLLGWWWVSFLDLSRRAGEGSWRTPWVSTGPGALGPHRARRGLGRGRARFTLRRLGTASRSMRGGREGSGPL